MRGFQQRMSAGSRARCLDPPLRQLPAPTLDGLDGEPWALCSRMTDAAYATLFPKETDDDAAVSFAVRRLPATGGRDQSELQIPCRTHQVCEPLHSQRASRCA